VGETPNSFAHSLTVTDHRSLTHTFTHTLTQPTAPRQQGESNNLAPLHRANLALFERPHARVSTEVRVLRRFRASNNTQSSAAAGRLRLVEASDVRQCTSLICLLQGARRVGIFRGIRNAWGGVGWALCGCTVHSLLTDLTKVHAPAIDAQE